MTAFTDDPMLAMITDQTDRLLQTVAGLSDAELRAASLLPGWTRGHVLTHVARNADGLGNVVRSCVTGEVIPMYASVERRNADIDAGAGRSPADIEADIESSAERLLALLADVPPDRVDVPVPTGRGFDLTAQKVLWMRVREVGYHHVDLGAGFTFADLPEVVLRQGLLECTDRLGSASPGAAVTARFADGEDLTLTIGDGAVAVSGTAADALAWLTGRSDGSGLITPDDVTLPDLPSWG